MLNIQRIKKKKKKIIIIELHIIGAKDKIVELDENSFVKKKLLRTE